MALCCHRSSAHAFQLFGSAAGVRVPGMPSQLMRGPPVLLDMTLEPKEVLMVVVKATALCSESTTDRWLVPWSSKPCMVQSPP